MKEREVVMAGAVRTPIGKFGGKLTPVSAAELGAIAAREALNRAGVNPDRVDLVVVGHARQAGNGPNLARQVAAGAGLPVTIPAFTINMACASGLQAVVTGAQAIHLGDAEVVLAAGTESMSNIPFLAWPRWGHRLGDLPLLDAMDRDGYLCPLCGLLMGETAETLVERYQISREDQDRYAIESQHRYQRAWEQGAVREELVPVEVRPPRGEPYTVLKDEHPREHVTLEALARLPPVFKEGGTVHAGNSSAITDGAAAVVLLSGEKAKELGVNPMARIVSYTSVGVEPALMGLGPVPAVRRLFERTRLSFQELDLIELNEAFACQVLACQRELGFDLKLTNVNGGAISLGHPTGATGVRILVTLLHEMGRRRARRGLATLCVSGGQGMALLVEGLR